MNYTRPPVWISKNAKKIWKELYPIVSEGGVLTNADYHPFLQLVCETAKYYELEKDLMEEGYVKDHTNKAGETNSVPNPKVRIQKACFENMHRLQKQFGIGAESRKKVPHKPKTENEFDEF